MLQATPDTLVADPEVLRGLADRYIAHHADLSNWFPIFTLEVALFRRLRIDPFRWQGRLAAFAFHSLVVLLPALILTAATGQWAAVPLLNWLVVAVGWGAGAMLCLPLFGSAARHILYWLDALTDPGDLRYAALWERRWFSNRVIVPVAAALTLCFALPALVMLRRSGIAVIAGTFYMIVFLIFMEMANATGVVMVVFEARNLSRYRTELYRLSPANSVPIRRSVRGYTQLGVTNLVIITMLLLLLLLLLPLDSAVGIWIIAAAVLVELAYSAVGMLGPRVIIGKVIRSAKEKDLLLLQRQIDALLPRLTSLADAEYKEMNRLQETERAIRESPDTLLPVGTILRTAGALLLSLFTVLATAVAREWIAALAKQLVP